MEVIVVRRVVLVVPADQLHLQLVILLIRQQVDVLKAEPELSRKAPETSRVIIPVSVPIIMVSKRRNPRPS